MVMNVCVAVVTGHACGRRTSSSSSSPPPDPAQWTINECSAWLESIELGELREYFVENSVEGAELLDLTEDDMKSMGITKLGHRKKLLKKIAMLRGDTVTTGSSSATTTAATSSIAADSSDPHDDDDRGRTYNSPTTQQ
jgi:hypothetical protein